MTKKAALGIIRVLGKIKSELTITGLNSILEYRITHRFISGNNQIDISIILCDWEEKDVTDLLEILILSKKTNEYNRKLEVLAINRDNSSAYDDNEEDIEKKLTTNLSTRNNLVKSKNQAAKIAQGETLIFASQGAKPTLQNVDLAIKELKKEGNGCVIIPNKPKESNRSPREEWVDYQEIIHYSNLLKAFVPIEDMGIDTGKDERLNNNLECVNLMACERSEFKNLNGFAEYYSDVFSQIDYYLKNKTILNKETKIYLNQQSCAKSKRISLVENIYTHSHTHYQDITRLNKGWGEKLKSLYLKALLTSKRKSFKVGIVVSEANDYTKYGDYYTALELTTELKNLGWAVEFIAVKGKKKRYQYDMSNIDCLINLLHDWDIGKAYNCKPSLIKVCWMRNWFESWWTSKNFLHYDLFLGSSKKACSYIEEMTGQEVNLLRIGGNHLRFKKGDNNKVDCIFTGNYWNAKRDIENFRPDLQDIEFQLYGKGWEKHPNLSKYSKGIKDYNDLPKLYQEARILIDDANHVTKRWGSANSRVFDGILSGNLVITNSKETSLDTFDGILPHYKNADELSELVHHYLNHTEERIKLAKRLREMVLFHHTYEIRALELKDILQNFIKNKKTLSIKIPVPSTSSNQYWGDFHYACGIAKEFRRKNWKVRIDPITHWYHGRCIEDKVTLNLKGLSKYEPCKSRINVVWIISHPELIDIKDLRNFDHIFVASDTYKDKILSRSTVKNVTTLLQCTDPSKFNILNKQDCDGITGKTILFIGNSRKQPRPIVINAIKAKYDLHVYGSMWKNLIPGKFIKGEKVKHEELNRYYQSCGVLLNDHWDLMRQEGFVSNRLFDGSAAGATIVSDKVDGIKEIFGGSIYEYDGTARDLKKKVDLALQERNCLKTLERRKKIAYYIAKHHSFEARFDKILSVIENLRNAGKQRRLNIGKPINNN